jgi:hypothetical protein
LSYGRDVNAVQFTVNSRADKPVKPQKPSRDPHATGRSAKKMRGQMRCSGRWDDPAGPY